MTSRKGVPLHWDEQNGYHTLQQQIMKYIYKQLIQAHPIILYECMTL